MQTALDRRLGYYQPTDKQRLALWLFGLDPDNPSGPPGGPVEELLFGGQAGGGKSGLIRIIAVALAHLWPGAKIAIFRLTYMALWDNHISKLLAELGDYGTYNHKRYEYTFPNGSVICFRAFDEEGELIVKTQGAEWAALLVDEATQFTWNMLSWMRSRVRVPDQPNWHPVILYCSNPGGASHSEMKQHFVNASEQAQGGIWLSPPIEDVKKRYRRFFLRARLQDNPHLSEDDVRLANASIADPELRRAVAEGDWNLSMGAAFREFRRNLHVVRRADEFVIPASWTVWRGYDWGYASPAACVWLARDPTVSYPRTYVFREWERRFIVTQEQARIIKAMSRRDPPARMTLADPMTNRRTSLTTRQQKLGDTYAAEMARGGIPLTMANNDRVLGWNRIHKGLDWGEERNVPPELMIFESCPVLIQQLEDTQQNPDKPEDIREPSNTDSVLRDDVLEATRYALVGARPASKAKRPPGVWGMSGGDRERASSGRGR